MTALSLKDDAEFAASPGWNEAVGRLPKLTIGEQLANYRARYGFSLSASKIAEPAVRALYWKQAMWAAAVELEGMSPRDYGPAELEWSDTYHQAREQWLRIGKTLFLHRKARQLELVA